MDNVGEAIAAINELKKDGIVADYAVGGAIALIFWSEPVATFDLDVFNVWNGWRRCSKRGTSTNRS